MWPIIFSFKGFTLSSYGLMLAVAFLIGIQITKTLGKDRGIGFEQVDQIAFIMIIAGIFGSRFLYTFVEHSDHYLRHPLEFFAFQKGGLSFFGGLFFAVFALWIYCLRKKETFMHVADVFSPSVVLGLSIAKIGCFLAGCCHGAACNLPWAISFSHAQTLASPRNVPMHPAQLYESLATLIMFFILLAIGKKKGFPGYVFLPMLAMYGVVRFGLEYFRGNPGYLTDLTTAQTLSIPMVLFAMIAYFIAKSKAAKVT